MPKSVPQEQDEKAFNETLKRMLKTPPKPHKDDAKKEKGDDKKPSPAPSKD